MDEAPGRGETAGPRARRDLWDAGVLPVLAAGALAGILGLYWDISWHIDKGRDTFFTPPHNFIYASLSIVLATSLYGLWRDHRESPFHLRFGSWRLHAGVLVVAIGAALVLAFAPLDDLWHRLFGVDVTLWGPMHLIGILGLTLACFGGMVSAWLERRLARDRQRWALFGDVALFFAVVLAGWAVLVQAEYEFSVPQYPSLWHPVLLAGLPGFALVLISRLHPRRWSATMAALGFTALRVAIAGWLIAASGLDLAGFSRPSIPLLIPGGGAVDLLTLKRAPGWLTGLVFGAVTLGANAVILDWAALQSGNGPSWTHNTLMTALAPGLILAAISGSAGAAVAGALAPGEQGGMPHTEGSPVGRVRA